MEEKNTSLDFRLKKINETRNYFLEEIKHNELINKKHNKTCKTLNYIKRLLIKHLLNTYQICLITARIKKYKAIIKKKRTHEKTVLLARTKLNSLEFLISEALIDSYINHDEFISINNVLKENDEIKGKIRNPSKE